MTGGSLPSVVGYSMATTGTFISLYKSSSLYTVCDNITLTFRF